jgi:hypothetical protein
MRIPAALALVALVAFTAAATPARAQSPSGPPPAVPNGAAPSFVQLFTGTVRDFRKLPTLDNLGWLAAGGVLSLATHEVDDRSTRLLAGNDGLREPFKAGAVLGGTPFELGAAFAAYGAGRVFKHDRLALVGADLVRVQIMAEALAIAVKQTTRRDRPSGSGFLSLGPHHGDLRGGHRAAAPFRLEGRHSGVRRRVVRRGVADSEPAPLFERCDLRCRAWSHRRPYDHAGPATRLHD